MTALLRGAALCVDATHPYATEATRNIRAAAAAAGVEYHRLLRPASPLPAGSVVLADAARAAAYLADRPGRVLLATGAKELPAFAALDPVRLYPRVCRRWQVSQHARQRAFRTAISLRCRGLLRKN